MKLNCCARCFLPALRRLYTNSASYEYNNKSASNGAQLVTINIPIVCWNIRPPNSTKISSIRYSSNFMKSVSEYFMVHQRDPGRSIYLCSQWQQNDNILKATVTILMDGTLVDNFLLFRFQFIVRNSCVKNRKILYCWRNEEIVPLHFIKALWFFGIHIWLTSLLEYAVLQYFWRPSLTAVRIRIKICERDLV